MTLYMENVADQTDHFADVFFRENVWKITDDTILYREVHFNVLAAFSVLILLE